METQDTAITLICFGPRYRDPYDEDAFEEWLSKITCIEEVRAAGRELYFYIQKEDLNDDCLSSLLALFYRYSIPNMEQFKPLVTDDNGNLIFGSKESYWYKKVFTTEKNDKKS